jgi:SAM-dependent methyltransferase
MPETLSQCPLCKDERSTLFDQREFRGLQVMNRLCSNCGLVYQSPRMTEDELQEFYNAEYRQIYQGDAGPIQKDMAIQKARAEANVALLKDWGIEQVGRFLDIGCSTGSFLEELRKVYKCQVIGIEPGEAYRQYTQSRDLTVFESLEAANAAGERKFDLIAMIHVLEHVPDPVGYLKELRNNYLKEDGTILIEVPNLYAHDSFEVAHMTSFSRHTLMEVVKLAGFNTKYLEMHGRPRSNLIPLYISLLAIPVKKAQSQLEIERWIRLKRSAGFAQRRALERLFPRQAWLPEFRG